MMAEPKRRLVRHRQIEVGFLLPVPPCSITPHDTGCNRICKQLLGGARCFCRSRPEAFRQRRQTNIFVDNTNYFV